MQPIPKQATCMGHWHADTSSQELGWHSSKQNRRSYWLWPAKHASIVCEQGPRLRGETGQTGVTRESCQPNVADFTPPRGKFQAL